jgi:hypothetical protein
VNSYLQHASHVPAGFGFLVSVAFGSACSSSGSAAARRCAFERRGPRARLRPRGPSRTRSGGAEALDSRAKARDAERTRFSPSASASGASEPLADCTCRLARIFGRDGGAVTPVVAVPPCFASSPAKDDEVDEVVVTAPELALLPNVGDYVDYANSINGDLPPEVRRPVVKGKVRSRFFIYRRITGGQVFCHINIVVEPMDVDSRSLVSG